MSSSNGSNGVQQFDNPAFEADAADTSTVSVTSDTKHVNGKAEAVNLEVVNFNAPEESSQPPQGQRKNGPENGVKNGKTEFDGGGVTVTPAGPELDPEHPDDQYFVSSSNRKKCMRGEKFYVSSDNDGSFCAGRRLWITAFLFVLAAAIGILFGALAANGMLDAGVNLDGKPSSTHSQLLDSSSARAEHAREFPANQIFDDNSVRDAIEGQLTITNYQFTRNLMDPQSLDFRQLAMALEDSLRKGLSESAELTEMEQGHMLIKVTGFQEGSIICTFRISWLLQHHQPLFTPDLARSHLTHYLKIHEGLLGPYLVPFATVRFYYIRDECSWRRGGCSHWCSFNVQTLLFECECPAQMTLAKDGKNCIPGTDHIRKTTTTPQSTTEEVSTSHKPEADQMDHSSNKYSGDHDFYPPLSTQDKEVPPQDEVKDEGADNAQAEPEPESEPEPSANKPEHAEPEAPAEPEPAATEPPRTLDLDLRLKQKEVQEPIIVHEMAHEAIAEPPASEEPAAEPETVPESSPEPEASGHENKEPSLEPETSPEPAAEPETSPEPAAEPETAPEPAAEPEVAPEPAAEPETSPEPAAEPETSPEPAAEPETAPKPAAEPEISPEPEAAPEPAAEPEASIEAKTSLEQEPKHADGQAVAEPEPEATEKAPTPEPSPEPAASQPSGAPKTDQEPANPESPVVSDSPPISDTKINNDLPTDGTASGEAAESSPSGESGPSSDAEEVATTPAAKSEEAAAAEPEPSAGESSAVLPEVQGSSNGSTEEPQSEPEPEPTTAQPLSSSSTTTPSREENAGLPASVGTSSEGPSSTESAAPELANSSSTTEGTDQMNHQKILHALGEDGLSHPDVHNMDAEMMHAATTGPDTPTDNAATTVLPEKILENSGIEEKQAAKDAPHRDPVDEIPQPMEALANKQARKEDEHNAGFLEKVLLDNENRNNLLNELDIDLVPNSNQRQRQGRVDPEKLDGAKPTEQTVVQEEKASEGSKDVPNAAVAEAALPPQTEAPVQLPEATTVEAVVEGDELETTTAAEEDELTTVGNEEPAETTIAPSQAEVKSADVLPASTEVPVIDSDVPATTTELAPEIEELPPTTVVPVGKEAHVENIPTTTVKTADEIVRDLSQNDTRQVAENMITSSAGIPSTTPLSEQSSVVETTTVATEPVEEEVAVTTSAPLSTLQGFSGVEGDIPSTLSLESLFTSESLRHESTLDFSRDTRALDIGFKGPKMSVGTKENALSDKGISNENKNDSPCGAREFHCGNWTAGGRVASTFEICVDISKRCDSVDDCPDGSDEVDCQANDCFGNFKCSNGSCIPKILECNGVQECSDGSDEAQCEKNSCTDGFKCPLESGGNCLPWTQVCDGRIDCMDRSDEAHCWASANCSDSNSKNHQCSSGKCLPMMAVCNGVNDCSDGSDEAICDCAVGQKKCRAGGCYPENAWCDGKEDCPDGSDEARCFVQDPQAMFLMFKGDYICRNGWSNDLSHLACQELGFSHSVLTKSYEVPEEVDSKIISLPKNFKADPASLARNGSKVNLQELLNRGELCPTRRAIVVQCAANNCRRGLEASHGEIRQRMVGGREEGTWPSIATLVHGESRRTCTATILSPLWVVTSLSCVDKAGMKPDDWLLLAGGVNVDGATKSKEKSSQLRLIDTVERNPQAARIPGSTLIDRDLCLMRLQRPLNFDQFVSPICLPEPFSTSQSARSLCFTAGGNLATGGMHLRQRVSYLPVPVLDQAECNGTSHYNGHLTENMLCAGFRAPSGHPVDKAPCRNDLGAPLMCYTETNSWEVVGVLSDPGLCGKTGHPPVYSSIAADSEWIKFVIQGGL